MNTIKFTIDGKLVQAKRNQTVLQAALEAGIEIPHLCYHPALSPFAGCRLCIVELKGAKTPLASCALKAKDGMEIIAHSTRLHELRKIILEIIISNHPLNCPTCEKNGVCNLQRYLYKFGLEKTSYEGERTTYHPESDNPLISMDYRRCIMCGRCVSACNEAVVNEAIDFTRRGFMAKITTPLETPRASSDCKFCGACVDVCPVGALTDMTAHFQGRIMDCHQVAVICPYCGCGCSILLDIKDDRIIRARGNPAGPVNQGWLCIKGHFGMGFVHHQDRLTSCEWRKTNNKLKNPQSKNQNLKLDLPVYISEALNKSLEESYQRLQKPLVRRNGILLETTWEEAIELVVKEFARIKKEFGPDALAVLSSAKCSNEENYLMQKFCRVLFGTNNIDHCARLCHAPSVAALTRAWGRGAMTNSIAEIAEADCILVIGSNTTEAHPVIGYAIKRRVRAGARLIVCDPREIELVKFAEVWLQQRCGTDVALINGLMNVIINEGLLNQEFIKKRTEGFEALKHVIENYPPEKVAQITGVSAEDIRKAARIYAQAKQAMIFYSMGITQHTTGTDNAMSLANLVMLCGQIGKTSSGLNPLRGQVNVQGACDMGCLPHVYPGYQPVTDPSIKEKFQQAYGIELSDKVGLTVTEIIEAAYQGKIKGLYIMGENPMLSNPNISHVDEALKNSTFWWSRIYF